MTNVARLGGYGDTSGSGLMFRNKLINGGFDIWQRGTSQTSSGYGSDDRWSNVNNGSTKTASQQTFTLGQTDVPGNPRYWARTIVTSVSNAANYVLKRQYIENVINLAGQTATLSFWAKADASKNIAVEFVQTFGTGGSPSSDVLSIGVTTFALTTSWKYFTTTINIPSISGKVLSSNNDSSLVLYFWFDAGSSFNARTNSLGQQSGTFDISNVQLEAGDQPTPFEQRPIGAELQLCSRYYKNLKNAAFIGVTGGTTSPVTLYVTEALFMRGGTTTLTSSATYRKLASGGVTVLGSQTLTTDSNGQTSISDTLPSTYAFAIYQCDTCALSSEL